MKSIMQFENECYVCHCKEPLHVHHVFEGTANRKKSEKWGLKIYLCPKHHNMSNEGVHSNKALELNLKRKAQMTFELLYGKELWMKEFKRNYLDV